MVPYAPTIVRTRPYNLVRTLAQRGHTITLATVWENEAERSVLQTFVAQGIRVIAEPLTRAQILRNLLTAWLCGQPLQSLYSWQPRLARRLVAEATHAAWEVVHVEHLRGAKYGLALRHAFLPIVWDSVDCISFLFEQAQRMSRNPFGRLVTRLELPRTRRHEATLLEQFAQVLVTSPLDRVAFEKLHDSRSAQACSIHVLPNGVDLDYFRPRAESRDSRTIILTGKMSYHANVTAALYLVNQVMPLVWRRVPEARVEIVGQNPTRAVRALAQKHPQRVIVTGTVTDIRPYLARATVAVAPMLYGAGIQNKILEAMAMTTPVVASARAVAALAVQPEHEVLIGDDAEALSYQIIRLFENDKWREQIGQQGRCYVERQHDWNKITIQLEQVYQHVLKRLV